MIQYVAVLTTVAHAVQGSPRAHPQQSKLLSNIIKISERGHEPSRYYYKIFCQATLPTALRTIWEEDLNLSFNELE